MKIIRFTQTLKYAEVKGLYDPEIATVPMERKIDMALELEKLALADPRVTKSSGAGYGESEGEVFIANSIGISKSYKCFRMFYWGKCGGRKGRTEKHRRRILYKEILLLILSRWRRLLPRLRRRHGKCLIPKWLRHRKLQ